MKKKLITIKNKAGAVKEVTPEHFARIKEVQKNSQPDQVFKEVKEKKEQD